MYIFDSYSMTNNNDFVEWKGLKQDDTITIKKTKVNF